MFKRFLKKRLDFTW